MGIITRMRKQEATYWAPNGFDRNGNPAFALPVVIDCRWEDSYELFMDAKGNQAVSKAKVYVDRDLEMRGYLMLGSSYVSDNPLQNPGVHAIRMFQILPNIRNTEQLRTAIL